MSIAAPSTTAFSVFPMVPFAPKAGATAGQPSPRCLYCGQDFAKRKPWAKFCSPSCQRKHRQDTDPNRRACVHCGRAYTPRYKKGKTNTGRGYCSQHCWSRARAISNPITCANCGVRFIVEPGRSPRKHCTTACARMSMGEKSRLRPDTQKPDELLEHSPAGRNIDRWFERLTDDQLRRVWVAAIVEQFGEGRRKELAAALRAVRERLSGGASDDAYRRGGLRDARAESEAA